MVSPLRAAAISAQERPRPAVGVIHDRERTQEDASFEGVQVGPPASSFASGTAAPVVDWHGVRAGGNSGVATSSGSWAERARKGRSGGSVRAQLSPRE